VWFASSPWGAFDTNSISFTGGGITQGSFSFIKPYHPVSLDAYNGGSVASTVSVTCGSHSIQTTVPVNQLIHITTGFTQNCAAVTMGSSNGWDTNFDNLVIANH
jgi:hypothetical protein